MFQTAEGVFVPFPQRIKEEYQRWPQAAAFHLSFEKLKPMLLDFIALAEEPLFLVLELPLNQAEEKTLRKADTDAFHKQVCYLDGQSRQQVLDILAEYGDILLNDGISQFAVASHQTGDEFFIQKYKLIHLYSQELERYTALLDKYGLRETTRLTTVWDTFSRESPGRVMRVSRGEQDIYSVYEALVAQGMYIAKVAEE